MKSAAVLCLLVLPCVPLRGQEPSSAASQSEQPNPLSVTIVQGEGAINSIRKHSTGEIAVRVIDSNQLPVGGVIVAFTVLSSHGAGGTFAGGAPSTAVLTGSDGLAAVRGFRPNRLAGRFEIRVSASYRGQTARATITQFNMLVDSRDVRRKSKAIAIFAIVGAAAAAGSYVALSRDEPRAAPAPPPPIAILPGLGTIAGPQ
jgi:hypothetical protein